MNVLFSTAIMVLQLCDIDMDINNSSDLKTIDVEEVINRQIWCLHLEISIFGALLNFSI